MQLAVIDGFSATEATERPMSFLSDMAARHASMLRQVSRSLGGRVDRRTLISLLNESLAAEIACMLRYRRHFYLVRRTQDVELMGELLDRANEEQRHADLIAERIVQLGGEPDLAPLSACVAQGHYTDDSSVMEMVREELAAERIAIAGYENLLRYIGRDDVVTSRLISEILAEEKEHAGELAARLEDINARQA